MVLSFEHEKRRYQEQFTYLKGIIEVGNVTEIIQELIDAGLIVLDERIKAHHVLFLGVGWFVREVLEHFGDLGGNRSI